MTRERYMHNLLARVNGGPIWHRYMIEYRNDPTFMHTYIRIFDHSKNPVGQIVEWVVPIREVEMLRVAQVVARAKLEKLIAEDEATIDDEDGKGSHDATGKI